MATVCSSSSNEVVIRLWKSRKRVNSSFWTWNKAGSTWILTILQGYVWIQAQRNCSLQHDFSFEGAVSYCCIVSLWSQIFCNDLFVCCGAFQMDDSFRSKDLKTFELTKKKISIAKIASEPNSWIMITFYWSNTAARALWRLVMKSTEARLSVIDVF